MPWSERYNSKLEDCEAKRDEEFFRAKDAREATGRRVEPRQSPLILHYE